MSTPSGDDALPLEHSPADVVCAAYAALGLLGGPDTPAPRPDTDDPWPAFVGSEPDDPPEVVTLYDTTPLRPARGVYRHGVQVRVRSDDEAAGRRRAGALADAADALGRLPASLGGRTYCLTAAVQTGVVRLGRGPTGDRGAAHTLNLLAVLRRTS